MPLPQHCKSCSYLLDKFGSCPYPDVSFIYSLISTLPYVIVIILLFVTLFKRKLSLIASSFIFISCYLFADRVVKNIIRDPRPEGACKLSFGFPSSHMTVMGIIAVFSARQSRNSFVVGIIISVIQGISRLKLQYHTVEQIIAGFLFGVICCMIQIKLLEVFYERNRKLIRQIPIIIDDINDRELKQN